MTLLDNKCYLFGGTNGHIFDEVHELNLTTYKWTLLAEVKYGYTGHSESTIDKKIYLFGGANLQGLKTNDLLIF